MDSNRWQRLQALYHSAEQIGVDERETWLREQCADEPALVREVLALFGTPTGQTEALRAAVGEAAAAVGETLNSSTLGTQFGAYRIERELGHGGMGRVFLATRADDAYEKQVAIKLLAAGNLSAVGKQQLAAERQILARLNHANIATLLDGGTSPDDVPYVVMEYIDGLAIDQYVADRSLATTGRVRLMLDVCAAVSHAHRNLVIHRDIKPSNVLVDAKGQPKLLDFGIAKMLDAERGSSNPTLAGVMTPVYASPEQVEGRPVSTATDIYSLGALLYHMLTDTPPFALSSASPAEIAKVICDTQPATPSTVAGLSPAVGKALRGDLDNIVLRAMHKSPDRRYSSVSALAEDLEAYLDERPVSARPDTLGYRASKFFRRNALVSSVALAFVVALGSLAAFYTVQLRSERDRALQAETEATAAAERARQEAATSERVTDFMVDLFEVADPRSGGRPNATAREVLDEGAAKIMTALEDEPGIQSRLLLRMGLAYTHMGDFEAGIPLVERSIEQLALDESATAMDKAELLNRLGEVLRQKGDRKRAATVHQQALLIKERESAGPTWRLADSYNNYGLLLYQLGRYEESANNLRNAIEMHRQAPDSQSKSIGISMHNFALVQRQRAQYKEADETMTLALENIAKLLESGAAPYAVSLQLAGRVKSDLAQFPAAKALLEEALERADEIYAPDNPRYGSIYERFGTMHCRLGELTEARLWYDKSFAVYALSHGVDSWNTAFVQHQFARCLVFSDLPEEARPLLEKSIAIREDEFGVDHVLTGMAEATLALAHAESDSNEAIRLARRALPKLRTSYDASHPDVAVATMALAVAKNDEQQLQSVLESLRPRGSTPLVRYVLTRQSNLAARRGDCNAAQSKLTAALKAAADYSPKHPWVSAQPKLPKPCV